MNNITTKTQYSKVFLSTKNKKKDVYFSLNYNVEYSHDKDDESLFSFEGNIQIKYLAEKKNGNLYINNQSSNSWCFDSSSISNSCDLHNSIMIDDDYRSYGIGSFVLNEVLQLFNEYSSNCSLEAPIAPNDNGEKNVKRRDHMYKNFGFEFIDNNIYIDKISNLNLNREFNYIEEIQLPIDFLTCMKKSINAEKKIKDIQKSYEGSCNMRREESIKNKKLKKANLLLCLLSISLIIIIILTI